ncbi:hypothetical protein J6590_000132 [Homalodisca vitripennis]|nr:hypothetical protein J6590_000132 [Homalodisca vitripennis]
MLLKYFEYIKSTATNWKCATCEANKSLRSDETPLTPTVVKSTPKFSESENDSESSTGPNKKLCGKCKKGFAHNAFKIQCVKCENMFHLKCTEPVLSKDDYVKAKRTWTCRVCVRSGRAELSLAIDTTDKGKDTVFVSQATSVVDIMNELRAFRQEIKEAKCDFRRQLETYSEWIVDNGKKIEEVNKKVNAVVKDMELLLQENTNLKKNIIELTDRVNNLEQTLRDKVVEIHGVPAKKAKI